MAAPTYSDDVRRFWLTFCAETGVGADQTYDAFAFGDSAEMADELAGLVLHGPKRATAGLLADYADEPLPEVGGHSIVLGGDGQPVCVIRTTEVRVLPSARWTPRSPGTRARATARSPTGATRTSASSCVCARPAERCSARRWKPSSNGSRWCGPPPAPI